MSARRRIARSLFMCRALCRHQLQHARVYRVITAIAGARRRRSTARGAVCVDGADQQHVICVQR